MAAHNYSILKINTEIGKTLPYRGRVVDLGCGTAPYKEFILKIADEYVGVDWEKSIHNQANIDVVADLCKPLPFEDNYADTVCSFQVIEHLSEPALFLSECFRICKPGGQIFLTSPFMWHTHEEPYDFFRYTRFGLEHLLGKNGFTDIEIKENTGFWLTVTLKFNYQTKRYARGPLKYLFMPFWYLNQPIARLLDRFDFNPKETASYTAIASKPEA